MTLEGILEAVRNHYLSRYREAIASYRKRFTPGGPEVLLETQGEQPLVYRYYRMDLASGAVDPPNFTEVNLSTHLEFENFRVESEGMTIHVSPMVWNGVEFRMQPCIVSDALLQVWALRWIDPEETTESDSDGLGAYIHSISKPDNESGTTNLAVDFGSAPVASVLEQLTVFRQSGVASVEIHSRAVLDE